MTNPRPARLAGAALAASLAVALGTVLAAGAAYGADDADPGLSVTVPSAAPTTTPTQEPTESPTPTPSATTTPDAPPTSGGRNGGGTVDPPDADEPSEPPATEPEIRDTPATDGIEAAVDKEHYGPGGTVVVTADGFDPGEQVQIVMYSTPHLVGNVAAADDGTFTHRFALPDDLAAGTHTVQLTGWQSGRIALVEILVTTTALSDDDQAHSGIPPWAWWVGGGLLAVLLTLAAWRVTRLMRAPVRPAEVLTA